MSTSRSLTLGLVVAGLLVSGLALGGAARASAQTPRPGWSIDSLAEPTNFAAAETQDAVQVFAIRATGGTYKLSVNGGETAEELSAAIDWNETASALQAKLEAVPDLGPGSVEVSGGPGDEQGTKPYSIRYVGRLSGLGGHLLLRESLLTGGEATLVQEEARNVQALAKDRYTITVTNVGSSPSQGAITVTDRLPSQLVVTAARVEERPSKRTEECSMTVPVRCEYSEPVAPGAKLVVTIQVAMSSPTFTGTLVNEATVSGGGGQPAATSESTPANVGPAAFGIDQFSFEAADPSGEADAQAGEHPYGVTTTLTFNTVLNAGSSQLYNVPEEDKSIAVELPLGFVGDPLVAERCPEVDMTDETGAAESGRTACPAGSVVGEVWLTTKGEGKWTAGPFPVYDIVPSRGYPAEFAFNYSGFGQPTFLYASVVPGESGYRMRIATPGAFRALHVDVERVSLTIFGDPSAHNGGAGNAAFVTNPTACSTEPLQASVEATAWEGGSAAREATAYPQVSGCDLLHGASAFSPQIELAPEQTQADTPSGYEADLKVPQAPNVFGELATPELKEASITLPSGLSLSPSVASGSSGLEACSPAQIDLLGTELGEGHPGGNGSPYDDGLTHASPGHCPEGSRVGEVEVTTPLLGGPLTGHVYVAQPLCGGAGQPECTQASAENGELYGVYLEMAGSGVILKLHGRLSVNAQTGLITTSFDENPELPFEQLKLRLYGGQRSSLANPPTCGAATATSDLEPWSAPESGPNATPSSSFAIGGCSGSMPFAPSFVSGSTQTLGGAYTPFTLSLTRKDGEQDLGGVSVTLPPGVSGMTANVPRCDEVDANAGTCPAASRIGTAHIAAGAGSQPLWLEGPVYFTGPYQGAPFGLSIVIAAKAGPFNLGEEVVRAGIAVNPQTAQATTTSESLRLIRDGVPFRIKAIDVAIDRPEFIFNPTSCAQEQVTGSIAGDLPDGSPGTTVSVSTPFAAAGCKNLSFDPSFKVSTQGLTSKAHGASLDVKVGMAAGAANLREVHVSLPKQLPSRLDTLKLACVDRVFEANPSACPSASAVGTATAITPILASPLTGPAYLVSHGGAEFPDVEMVLQGEGVTLVLDGKTDIKKDITTSTFDTIPDAPVRAFELKLPEGTHSVLGAPGGKLCSESLTMPTTLRGQNGALVQQSTKVAVTGCRPAIVVLHHSVSDATATIVASVPAAGTLSASAPGLSPALARAGKAGRVTLRLALTGAERRFLAGHPGRRLRVRARLRFAPRHGRALFAGVTLLVG